MKGFVFLTIFVSAHAFMLHPLRPLRDQADLCRNIQPTVRCNEKIVNDKLHLISEQAGYAVSLEDVKRRSQLVISDIRRLGRKYGVPVDADVQCIFTVICEININPDGLDLFITKVNELMFNLIHGKSPEKSDFIGIQSEIKLLRLLKESLKEYSERPAGKLS